MQDRLIQNIGWLSVGHVLVKPAWLFFITAWCMRVLGTQGYGVLTVALSLMTFAAYFSDFGTTQLTIREVAREPRRASEYLANLLLARIVLGLLVWSIMVTALSGLAWYSSAELWAIAAAGQPAPIQTGRGPAY